MKTFLNLDPDQYSAARQEEAGGASGDATPMGTEQAPQGPPVITVQNNGDGTFVISGTNFVPSHSVTVQVVGISSDASGIALGGYSSDSNGGLSAPTGVLLQVSANLYFQATDGRVGGDGKVIWSNNFHILFIGKPPDQDQPDDPPDPEPSDPPADPPSDPGTSSDPPPAEEGKAGDADG